MCSVSWSLDLYDFAATEDEIDCSRVTNKLTIDCISALRQMENKQGANLGRVGEEMA